jgi:hypothetical protein
LLQNLRSTDRGFDLHEKPRNMATSLKDGINALTAGLLVFSLSQLPLSAQGQEAPKELKIVVIQGDGAINKVRRPAAVEPSVAIEDENQKPIAGATVIFTLPTEGTTGQFGSGGQKFTTMTDAQGHATAAGLKVNEYPGNLLVEVNASYRGLAARAVITQTDEGPPVTKPQASSGGHRKLVVILAVVAAAAGGGAYYALSRGGGSTSSSTGTSTTGPAAIGLTPGTPTIIGPH